MCISLQSLLSLLIYTKILSFSYIYAKFNSAVRFYKGNGFSQRQLDVEKLLPLSLQIDFDAAYFADRSGILVANINDKNKSSSLTKIHNLDR